jgi:hypothetical protein
MFKNGKISSDASMKKETLEELGYSFEYMSKKTGWRWSAPSDSSTNNEISESDIINSAWEDASEQARRILDISESNWSSMGGKEQKELIDEALTSD